MNIVKNRKIIFAASTIIIVLGLILAAVRGLNYGIDFTGGTLIQIDLEKQLPVEEVKKIVDEFDTNASIIHAGENKQEVIIKSSLSLNRKQSNEIFKKFKDTYKLKSNEPIQVESTGSTIGKEIQNKALLSLFISSIGMLIYITIRFEFKFGMAAVLALIHDAFFMFSVYSIFKLQIDGTFIAAILTIIGYSINDTIIIFDRIRENLKIAKTRDYEELVNTSVKQTLRRTLGTSFTTLITILLIYILGVDAIRIFALPLIIGVIIGTYSSLFIATPLWYIFRTRKPKVKTN